MLFILMIVSETPGRRFHHLFFVTEKRPDFWNHQVFYLRSPRFLLGNCFSDSMVRL